MWSRAVRFLGTLCACVAVAMWECAVIVCLMLQRLFPGRCAMRPGRWCSRGKLAVMGRAVSMPSEGSMAIEPLIEAVNRALEAGNWSQVVALTSDLYAAAVAVEEGQLAELVQDLHWIANDVLAHPLE